MIEKAQELAKGGPLPAEAVGRIYQKLVEEMRNWEAKLDATASQSSSRQAAANKIFVSLPTILAQTYPPSSPTRLIATWKSVNTVRIMEF